MDPLTLATTAIGSVIPYLTELGKDIGNDVADSAGKAVWDWMKERLTSPAGAEAVGDLANDPNDQPNQRALEAALAKTLRSTPEALAELKELLTPPETPNVSQVRNIPGSNNKSVQIAGSGNSVA
jgi:hypothetical protein